MLIKRRKEEEGNKKNWEEEEEAGSGHQEGRKKPKTTANNCYKRCSFPFPSFFLFFSPDLPNDLYSFLPFFLFSL